MTVPEDFKALLPQKAAHEPTERDKRPFYVLWVFDPQDGKVHVEHNEDRHRADAVTHAHMAEKVAHPERVHGYAYSIKGGWRITDWDHKALDDRFILKQVRKALRKFS